MTGMGETVPRPDAGAARLPPVPQNQRTRTTSDLEREQARRQRQLAHQMSAWAGEMLAGASWQARRPPGEPAQDAGNVPVVDPPRR